ncbi:MAG: hypothetical protein ACRD2U_06170 [Terriglobales bacterium]
MQRETHNSYVGGVPKFAAALILIEIGHRTCAGTALIPAGATWATGWSLAKASGTGLRGNRENGKLGS